MASFRLGARGPGCLLLGMTMLWAGVTAHAQVRARVPGNTISSQPALGGDTSSGGPAIGATLAPLQPSGTTAAAALGQPTFDPYSTSTGASSSGFSLFGGPTPPPSTPPPLGGQPPAVYPPPASLPPSLQTPYSGTPPALFPNGIGGPHGMWSPNGTIVGAPVRLIQGPRIRHAWLAGGDGQDLGINDSDISVVLTYPNFLFSHQPLYVAPSFSLHLWDGPAADTFPTDADLPSRAYSAFLDSLWRSDPNGLLGIDLGARVGAFTDFDTFNSDSLRVMGQAILRMRLTPTVTLKGGAIYTDRASVKLIPAGGILWEPNPQTRFDIYFPQPKAAQYLTTLGNQDVWWYVAGEFGGGSWTIERELGGSDQIDINDIRVILGIEWGPADWFRDGRRLGFLEVGWVTERELVYVNQPEDSTDINDTVMVRAGIGY